MKNRNTKQWLSILVAVLMLASMFAGCSKPAEAPATTEAPADAQPAQSAPPAAAAAVESTEDEVVNTEKDTISIAVDREPASLDPAVYVTNWQAQDQIYEGLVAYALDGSIEPCLAESYEQVDDLTWKFKLREDVTFHNGEHMTSADVLYSFQRAMTFPQAASILSNLDAESFEAPDDYTFILKTKTPYAFTLQNLCETYLCITNQKAVEDAGSPEAFGRNPVGTGAYKFVSWVAGDSIKLTRFDEYWGEPAKVENVVVKMITEGTTRTIDLEAGGSDINWVVSSEDYERVANGENTSVVMYTVGAYRYFPLNVTKEPLNDVRVRQALQYATDSETIWKVVFGEDTADYSTCVIAPGISGRDEDATQYGYDPEKAKQLLAEAGYPNGFEIEFLQLSNAIEDMIVTLLKEQWAAAGITLNIYPVDSAGINSRLNEGNYYTSSLQAKVQPIDAGYIMWKLFHSSNCGTSNRSYISDEELDAILDEICVTVDKDARDALAIKAQERVNELACVINFCHLHALNGLRSDVRGYEASGYRRPLLKNVYFVVEE